MHTYTHTQNNESTYHIMKPFLSYGVKWFLVYFLVFYIVLCGIFKLPCIYKDVEKERKKEKGEKRERERAKKKMVQYQQYTQKHITHVYIYKFFLLLYDLVHLKKCVSPLRLPYMAFVRSFLKVLYSFFIVFDSFDLLPLLMCVFAAAAAMVTLSDETICRILNMKHNRRFSILILLKK